MSGASLVAKHSINLLQPELLPKQPLVTLHRMLLVWGVVLALMLAWSQYLESQNKSLTQTTDKLSVENKNKTVIFAEIQKKIKARRTDPALEAKYSTLKLVMKNKQALHARLTDPKQTYSTGFAHSMTELSKYHHKDISLQQVIIDQNEMSFSGLAKKPESVPQWLSGFEQSELLSGKHFKHFKLEENENKITVFTIGSTFNAITKESSQ